MSYIPPFTISSKILIQVSNISEILATFKDLLLSHKLMMGELLNDAGVYRNVSVGIGGEDGVTHIAPAPFLVPQLMGDLFSWLEHTKEHPLIVSCIFHYEFEFIHPFSDGNGRVGRLWQSVILNEYKSIFGFIPIESLVREQQQEYYKALEDAGASGESTPFIELIDKDADMTIAQMAELLSVTDKMIKRDIVKLKEQGRVRRVGSLKSGNWEVL